MRIAGAAASALFIAACGAGNPATQMPTSEPSAAPTILATPVPTLSPTTTPTVTSAPGPTPTATAALGAALTYPPELDFVNEYAIRVTVAQLNVRAAPKSTGQKLATLPKGAIVLVRDWPVHAGGYTWYFGYQPMLPPGGAIPQLPTPLAPGIDPVAGWIAAGTSADAYVLPIAPRCPSVVDLANVEGMLNSELIACFGTRAFVLQGTFGCGGCGGTDSGRYAPEWLAARSDYDFLSRNPSAIVGPMALRFPPSGPVRPPQGSIIKVTVHLEDPAASTCAVKAVNDSGTLVSIAPAAAGTWCRSQLVVERYDVLGTDPRFPPG
jgi:hypothetical protein